MRRALKPCSAAPPAQPTSTAQERQNLALVLGLEGKSAEAEHLMRQDLPPEIADANLAYFKGTAAPAAVTPVSSAAPPVKPQAQPARTWGSVQQSDAKGGVIGRPFHSLHEVLAD